MKIIDAHIHYARAEHFEACALDAGHILTNEHLQQVFSQNNIRAAVAMGTLHTSYSSGTPEASLQLEKDANATLSIPRVINLGGDFSLQDYGQPNNIFYCAGVASETLTETNVNKSLELFEKHLQTPGCVGVKLYPGYNYFYVTDKLYHGFYDLARSYDVPIVIHTGDTSRPAGMLKYSHPLTVDEVAVMFPQTRFVIAHLGNPWIVDAVAVVKKNHNVYADLSGLAAGDFTADWFFKEYHGYVEHLKTWLQYLGRYDKLMYGTDWPLVNIPTYIEIIKHIIPKQYQKQVFYDNAVKVFKLPF